MRDRLQTFRDEFRTNGKVRLGIWLIVAILVLYMILLLQDVNTDLRHKCAAQLEKRARLEAIADEHIWKKRAKSAKKAYVDELKYFPVIQSEGLARAGVENQVSAMLSRIGVRNSRLQMDQFNALASHPGIRQLPIRIEGVFAPVALLRLLYALQRLHQRGEVMQLTIARGSNSRFELVYALYFRQSFAGKNGS